MQVTIMAGGKGTRVSSIAGDIPKPKPGMILKAAKKYNIDLSRSYMAGDDMRDVNAGINAGCIPVFLTNNKPIESMNNIKTFANLRDFTEQLSKEFQ